MSLINSIIKPLTWFHRTLLNPSSHAEKVRDWWLVNDQTVRSVRLRAEENDNNKTIKKHRQSAVESEGLQSIKFPFIEGKTFSDTDAGGVYNGNGKIAQGPYYCNCLKTGCSDPYRPN